MDANKMTTGEKVLAITGQIIATFAAAVVIAWLLS